jgi:hypothetical protein
VVWTPNYRLHNTSAPNGPHCYSMDMVQQAALEAAWAEPHIGGTGPDSRPGPRCGAALRAHFPGLRGYPDASEWNLGRPCPDTVTLGSRHYQADTFTRCREDAC